LRLYISPLQLCFLITRKLGLDIIYRVGDEKHEMIVEILDKRIQQEFIGKIRKSFISLQEMRERNERIVEMWHDIATFYKPVMSQLYHVGDSLLLFDFNNQSINCFDNYSNMRWRTRIIPDMSKDFTGRIHWDRITNRYFLEFLNIQLSYLIEIEPYSGSVLNTIPIHNFKHIDHISIHNNRIFFLHQPDFGDRGKKLYFLDI